MIRIDTVNPAPRPDGIAPRRGFIATLLALLGLAPASPPPAPRVVERDGWILDARDR